MPLPNKNIAFWGVSPPPIGGMTVHIGRLSRFLMNNNWAVCMYNFYLPLRDEKHIVNVESQWVWYLKLLLGKSPSIHYVISTKGHIRFLAAILGLLRGKKVILRVGGQSLEDALNSGGISKWLNILALKLCACFIGVNDQICKLASQYASSSKINCIPGFIPPQTEPSEPPKEVSDFWGNAEVKMVVTGRIASPPELDIYGLWDVLKVMELIKKHHKNLSVRCCVVTYEATGLASEECRRYQKNIIQKDLQEEVLLYSSKDELWPIIDAADIFLRPSYSDGDSNAIREALYLKKTVVASDCVKRPAGCVTYPSGDINSFYRTVVDSCQQAPGEISFDGTENLRNLNLLLNKLI